MTVDALQTELDRPGGPHFTNNGYYQPLHRREPAVRYKVLDRHNRNFGKKRGH